MKKIPSKELHPGMVVARDVLTEKNNILLEKGSVISSKDIAKLAFYAVSEVEIEKDISPEFEKNSDSDGLTSTERLKKSKVFKEFKRDFEACAHKFEENINAVVSGNTSIDTKLFLDPVYALLKKGKTPADVFNMLHILRDYDDATYTHCINVALSANILAQWLKWNDEEIEIATLSGLFHDIGKIAIPEKIITKPGKLNDEEMEIVKTHPQKGFDAIKDLDISIHVKNAALMHHERCDGSGYPQSIRGPMIDKYAKIVAISDVYDAMTSKRCYRKPMCPFVALQTFEEEGFQKYDTEMILCFLQNIVSTYLLATVRLNTGEVGEIVFINRTFLSKPTIKIDDDYVDLSRLKGVYIEEVL